MFQLMGKKEKKIYAKKTYGMGGTVSKVLFPSFSVERGALEKQLPQSLQVEKSAIDKKIKTLQNEIKTAKELKVQ